MLGAVDPWTWQAHPEVWLLVGGIAALGIAAVRVIGPKVVPAGEPVVTRRQRVSFWLALFLLWMAADWPMHDIAEEYLYSVHMVQHLLITFVVPPLFLMATPEWLARLVLLDDSRVSRALRWLAAPIVAAIVFNALQALTHWNVVVNTSIDSGPFHYAMHLVLFSAALLAWVPVVGPLPEMRLSLPGQMIYLFLMSIVPTVPAGWLVFADGPVYSAYDHADRLWGISVRSDQQAAGMIMKVIGGFYLWILIAILWFKWSAQHLSRDRRTVVRRSDLTYEHVAHEFARSEPPLDATRSNPQ